MSNKVYTIKIAEAHLNAITNALSAHPWKDVASIMASIGQQVQAQRIADIEKKANEAAEQSEPIEA